eukprot:SAG22_NODE_1008_length_6054_cov_11.023678_1_plen_90_part_10
MSSILATQLQLSKLITKATATSRAGHLLTLKDVIGPPVRHRTLALPFPLPSPCVPLPLLAVPLHPMPSSLAHRRPSFLGCRPPARPPARP